MYELFVFFFVGCINHRRKTKNLVPLETFVYDGEKREISFAGVIADFAELEMFEVYCNTIVYHSNIARQRTVYCYTFKSSRTVRRAHKNFSHETLPRR